MMSEASTGVDAEMRPLTLAAWRYSGKEIEPSGTLPNDRTGRPKGKKLKKSFLFFLGSLLRDRHFLHVLNWPCPVVSSTGLPGADCFHIGQCFVPVLVREK